MAGIDLAAQVVHQVAVGGPQHLDGERLGCQRPVALLQHRPALGREQVRVPRGQTAQALLLALVDPLRVTAQVGQPAVAHHAVGRHVEGEPVIRRMPDDEVVVEGGEEDRVARVSLAACASPELVLESRRREQPHADHPQTACGHRGVGQPDVGAPSRQLRRDGDPPGRARLGDDRRLVVGVGGVQDRRGEPGGGEDGAVADGVGHRPAGDQHRAALLVRLPHLGHQRRVAMFGRVEEEGGAVQAQAGGGRGQLHHMHAVGLLQLGAGAEQGGAHPHNGVVHAHQLADDELVEHLEPGLGGQRLLGLDRRLQPVGPALQLLDPAARAADQPHPASGHHVVDVAGQQRLRVQRGVDAHEELGVAVEQVAAGKGRLDLGQPRLRQVDGAVIGRAVVVEAGGQPTGEGGQIPGRVVGLQRTLGRQHQRHACLVQQHCVGLVDDDGVADSARAQGCVDREAVPEHVESGLGDRDVDHVAGVGRPSGPRVGVRGDVADAAFQRREQRPHPGGVAPGQVVVGGEHVHASPAGDEPGGGHGTHEGLPLARRQFDGEAAQHRQRRALLRRERRQPDGGGGRGEDRGEFAGLLLVGGQAPEQPRVRPPVEPAAGGVGGGTAGALRHRRALPVGDPQATDRGPDRPRQARPVIRRRISSAPGPAAWPSPMERPVRIMAMDSAGACAAAPSPAAQSASTATNRTPSRGEGA